MIRIFFFASVLACSSGWVVADSSSEHTIAGRTIADYHSQVDDENRVVRLRAVRSLAAFKSAAIDELTKALDHQDAAVRYLAAEALGDIGQAASPQAQQRLTEMAKNDPSRAAKNAASYALCRFGLVDEHLPQLIESLAYPERGMVCSTAELIGKIGPSAAAATKTLQQMTIDHAPGGKGDYHIGGAATNALRKIQNEQPAQQPPAQQPGDQQ